MKVWEEIAQELNKRFETKRVAEKCEAKIEYLVDKEESTNRAGR